MIAFIDESKAKSYLLVAALVNPSRMTAIRKELSGNLLAGQRSWHFRKESKPRRRLLIGILKELKLNSIVLRVAGESRVIAREILISKLVSESVRLGIREIIFELDESSYELDIKLLNKLRPTAPWDHRVRHQEPLLWVADAVAWCLNRGGDWERMVRPLIIETIDC